MQFRPGDAPDPRTWFDISFCRHMEPDPLEWGVDCMQALDLYLVHMGANAILQDGPQRTRVREQLVVLQRKFPAAATDILLAYLSRFETLAAPATLARATLEAELQVGLGLSRFCLGL